MTDWVTCKSSSCGPVAEWFITAVPDSQGDVTDQAQRLYRRIKDHLQTHAYVFMERIFATGQVEAILQARAEVWGGDADEVQPSVLLSQPAEDAELCGIQVHAMAGMDRPEVVKGADGEAFGRLVLAQDCRYVGLSAVWPAANEESGFTQALTMFERAQSLLDSVGSCFLDVPRTWLWLHNILSWYDDLNRARTRFFRQIGLLREGEACPMPASTGISLTPGGRCQGGICSMDLVAVFDSETPITYAQAGGKQHSAFNYGSAFSRAARAFTPGGETLFISGTASIDKAGQTTHLDDAEGQIRTTIRNVKALLTDMDFDEQDVVQVMLYCKTPEIKRLFEGLSGRPNWPWITMVCDVCRDNLLFEIEALACRDR